MSREQGAEDEPDYLRLLCLCRHACIVPCAGDMTKLMASIKKSLSTSAKDGKFRELVVESICTGQARAGLAFLEKFIGSGFRRNKDRTLDSLQAGLLAHAGDATAFL